MQFNQSGNTFIIYLVKDEKVISTLTQFCEDHDIQNGQISGIGAIKNIEMGAYNLEGRQYTVHNIEDSWELTSLQANILLKDGEPYIHAHATISNHDLKVKGGHLFEADVAVVGEFILHKIETKGIRKLDPEIGLAAICFVD